MQLHGEKHVPVQLQVSIQQVPHYNTECRPALL